MQFKSRISKVMVFLTVAPIALPFVFVFVNWLMVDKIPWIFLIIYTLPSVVIFWIFLDTGYTISNDFIYYRTGPIRGSIRINSIRKIEKNTTLWVGFKPALATKGIIIHYNKFDQIYFSPERQEDFIKALLIQNPSIQFLNKSGQNT